MFVKIRDRIFYLTEEHHVMVQTYQEFIAYCEENGYEPEDREMIEYYHDRIELYGDEVTREQLEVALALFN